MNDTKNNHKLVLIWSKDVQKFRRGIKAIRGVIKSIFMFIKLKHSYHRFKKRPTIKNHNKLIKILNKC